MRGYAPQARRRRGAVGVAGLLHDADYERLPTWTTRRTATRASILAELERARRRPRDRRARSPRTPTSWASRASRDMEKTLFAVDELSGFMLACAYVRPEGIHGLTPKSVKKKLKQPAFAAAVNRDEVREGAEELGVDFDEHVAFVIAALEERADELELHGRERRSRILPDGDARASATRASCARRTSRALLRRRGPSRAADRHRRPGDRPVRARARPAPSRAPAPVAAAFGARRSALTAPLLGPADRPPRPAPGHRAARAGPRRGDAARSSSLRARPDAPVGVLVALRRAGGRVPPAAVGSILRALWPRPARTRIPSCCRPRSRSTASLIELVFVAGPLLTAPLSALGRPRSALLVALRLLVVVGTLVLRASRRRATWAISEDARQPRARSARCARRACARSSSHAPDRLLLRRDGGRRCPRSARTTARAAGRRADRGLVARQRRGRPGLRRARTGRGARGAPLRAAGGAAAARLRCRWRSRRRSRRDAAARAARRAVHRADCSTAGNQLVGDVAPRGARDRGLRWPITALVVGAAAGNAAAGAIVEAADWRAAFLVGLPAARR